MLIEWALESNANPTTVISLSGKWDLFSTHGKVGPSNAYLVAVTNLLAAQEGDQSPLKWWRYLSLCKGMEQPLAESPTREGKRTTTEPSIWHAPSRPQAYVRGRCTTESDDMFILVKEGIRKLCDLNTVRGNNTQYILLRRHLVARTSSVEQEFAPQIR